MYRRVYTRQSSQKHGRRWKSLLKLSTKQRFWLQYYLEGFPELKLNKKKLIDVVNFLNKKGRESEKLDKRHVLVKSKDNFYVKVEGIHGW